MFSMPSNKPVDYFALHGLSPTAPAELNASLALAIEEVRATLYGEGGDELTAGERAVLEAGGVRFDKKLKGDPLADSIVKYAALLESCLSTREVAERLHLPESRVRQLVTRRTLYSVLIDGRRHVLAYQFRADGTLVPNIGKVNAALDPELHPLEVHDWFTEPHMELFVGDDIDAPVSPLQWLESGGSVKTVVRLARLHH